MTVKLGLDAKLFRNTGTTPLRPGTKSPTSAM